MKNLCNFLKKKNFLEPEIDKEEIINFYLQLIKMKKKRPHMNTINLLKKCYPNATEFIDDLVANDQSKK